MNTKFNLSYYSWPIGIVTFLGAVVSLNIFLLLYSLKVQRAVVEPNPYEQGMGYEKILEELKTNEFYLAVHYEREIVSATLRSKMGAPISNARVIVTLTHPSDSSLDRQIDLLETDKGFYLSKVSLTPGIWMSRVLVQVEGIRQRRQETIRVR